MWLVILTGILWSFYSERQKYLPFTIIDAHGRIRKHAVVVTIAAVVVFTIAFVGKKTFLRQAVHIWSALTGTAGIAQQDVTLLFLVGMTVVAVFVFCMEFIWKGHGILCLLLTTMLILGPVFGISSSYRAVLFLSMFQISFFMHTPMPEKNATKSGASAAQRVGEENFPTRYKHTPMPLQKQGKNATKSGASAAGILTGITFAAVFLLVSFCQEYLYHSAYQVEYFVHNAVMHLTGKADEAVADGHINRGNKYETGTVQMEIETYELPSETLYLCGFRGNQYTGGEWKTADNAKLLEQASQMLGLTERVNTISTRYGGMYYTLNSFLSEEGIKNSRNINIKHASGKYRNYFEPYGGQWTSDTTYGLYMYSGYNYRYYEQADMKIDWNNVSKAFSSQAMWYGNLQDAYMDAVSRGCMDVPRERLPRLAELCETYQLEDFNEITAFITATLGARAFYTQTPGNAPANKDIVEYFLFENRKGYCQHFASAAALMYRLYGVPARYATGYRVHPSDFQLEKGVYRAYVTDEAAHAWVEVFIKDYGWVPIEVTPQDDGNIRPFYPGIDMAGWEQILEKYSWNFDIDVPASEEALQEDLDNTWEWDDIPWENYEGFLRILETVIIYTLVLTPFFFNYRRLRYQERFYGEDCCKQFNRLIQMLHYAGYLADCDGTEEDFAKRLSEQFPSIKVGDIDRMVNIVEKAAYGRPENLSKMEEAFAKELCRDCSKLIYDSLKWYRKWGFILSLPDKNY